MNAKKGTPTPTNLYVLGRLFAAGERVTNRVEPPDAPHLKRCLTAGLCVVDGTTLVLTAEGRSALRRTA